MKQIGTISKAKIPLYTVEGCNFCRISDVPEPLQPKLEKWLYGQTCPLIDGVPDAILPHDLERWIQMIVENKPTYFD